MFTITATVTKISDTILLKGSGGNERKKICVGVETADSQTLFVDLLDSKMKSANNISVGDHVKVTFSLKGIKTVDGRMYNNIYCHEILKIE